MIKRNLMVKLLSHKAKDKVKFDENLRAKSDAETWSGNFQTDDVWKAASQKGGSRHHTQFAGRTCC